MSTTWMKYQAGRSNGRSIHAMRKVQGVTAKHFMALCGTRKIKVMGGMSFDEFDPDACKNCLRLRRPVETVGGLP